LDVTGLASVGLPGPSVADTEEDHDEEPPYQELPGVEDHDEEPPGVEDHDEEPP